MSDLSNKRSKFYTALVVGDNPEELMKAYDKNVSVKPYVKYKYLDAEKMLKATMKGLDEIIKDPNKFGLSDFSLDLIKERRKILGNMKPFEYYQAITEGMYYDSDGNALSEENQNGKWHTFRIGGNFAIPLLTKDGKEVYQAKNKDIDWEKIHNTRTDDYKSAWEVVVEGRAPETPEETTIFNMMGDKKEYFKRFKSKEDYITYSCSYWNYAFLDKDGWKDLDDNGKEMDWIKNFFNKYIKTLKSDDLVTIYEYTRRD